MSAIDLLQPLLDGGVKRNNFFNGRLLSAEDLRAEQDATLRQLRDHGRAFGDGVAWGMAVEIVSQEAAQPVVRVAPGLALNRLGDALRLEDPVDVRLVPEETSTEVLAGRFAACEQPRQLATLGGAGAWVLAATPVSGYREMATVSDPNATAIGRGACGARFRMEGLAFRLAAVALDQPHGLVPDGIDGGGTLESTLRSRIDALLDATGAPARERLRNVLAHACYGSGTLAAAWHDPWRRFTDAGRAVTDAPVWRRWGLLDAMRERGDLTDCDVPLALVVLDATGIRLVDLWSVRRRPIDALAVDGWRVPAGGRRRAEGEAAFLQFQSQLEIVRTATATPGSVAADAWFDWLPAAGWLPIATGTFAWKTFLGAHAPAAETSVDAALLRGIVERSWDDEPFALATTPPVPLRVYRVPGDDAVVFARSRAAQLRLVFTPSPAASEAFVATVEPDRGATVRSAVYAGGAMLVGELPAGTAKLDLQSSSYQAVTRTGLALVEGRTLDVAIALTSPQNGSITVTTVDKATGAPIGTQVDDVVATGPSPATATRHGTRQSSGKWLVGGLAAGSYALRGTAPGYQPAALAQQLSVTATGNLDATLDFARLPAAPTRPARCINVKALRQLEALKKLRLCMILAGAVFERKHFAETRPTRTAKITSPQSKFSVEKRAKAREGYEIAEDGVLVYDADNVPWKAMTRAQPEPAELTKWLAAWRDWLAITFDDQAIGKSEPTLYVDAEFAPPDSFERVRKTPPAYAVFATMAIPVSIGVAEMSTKGPVDAREAGLRGIPEETYKELDDHDLRTINDWVWIWEEIMEDITGDPSHTVQLTIAEAQQTVAPINEGLRYYAGVDQEAQAKLQQVGLTSDSDIAGATIVALTEALGSASFAYRLQQQAKAIVANQV